MFLKKFQERVLFALFLEIKTVFSLKRLKQFNFNNFFVIFFGNNTHLIVINILNPLRIIFNIFETPQIKYSNHLDSTN